MVAMLVSRAIASPNLAFIKYWGNSDENLHLPTNGSISMTLGGLSTESEVGFSDEYTADELIINGQVADASATRRASRHLEKVRGLAGCKLRAHVESTTNFPVSAGLASSASAFAALTVAATHALGLNLSEREMSALARLGSGSAARSIPGGFVEWKVGRSHLESYGEQILPPTHWSLVDLIAVVSRAPKGTTSTDGHLLARTSPLQEVRTVSCVSRLDECRSSLFDRDFQGLARVSELDSIMLHAVAMTSQPPLFYWTASTFDIMISVRMWRAEGLDVFATVDAGANVHCVCSEESSEEVRQRLVSHPAVLEVIRASVGEAARVCPA